MGRPPPFRGCFILSLTEYDVEGKKSLRIEAPLSRTSYLGATNRINHRAPFRLSFVPVGLPT